MQFQETIKDFVHLSTLEAFEFEQNVTFNRLNLYAVCRLQSSLYLSVRLDQLLLATWREAANICTVHNLSD